MKSEYTLSKYRYYELKHFCLQYNEWKKIYCDADGYSGNGDTTSRDGIKRADIARFVELIEACANLVGNDILPYVTKEKLKLPVELRYSYSRFFYELSKRR